MSLICSDQMHLQRQNLLRPSPLSLSPWPLPLHSQASTAPRETQQALAPTVLRTQSAQPPNSAGSQLPASTIIADNRATFGETPSLPRNAQKKTSRKGGWCSVSALSPIRAIWGFALTTCFWAHYAVRCQYHTPPRESRIILLLTHFYLILNQWVRRKAPKRMTFSPIHGQNAAHERTTQTFYGCLNPTSSAHDAAGVSDAR